MGINTYDQKTEILGSQEPNIITKEQFLAYCDKTNEFAMSMFGEGIHVVVGLYARSLDGKDHISTMMACNTATGTDMLEAMALRLRKGFMAIVEAWKSRQ